MEVGQGPRVCRDTDLDLHRESVHNTFSHPEDTGSDQRETWGSCQGTGHVRRRATRVPLPSFLVPG